MKSSFKNNNMTQEQETIEQTKPKMYVWSKTERAGDIVTVDTTDGDFTIFTDGTRINSSLMNEFLMEAANDTQAAALAQPFVDVEESKGLSEIKEPQRDPDPVETGTVNVMLEMRRKISAKNTLTMPIELNLPSTEVYSLFKNQMDITEEELNDHILELVLSQIDNLQEQLKPQAKEFINDYYNGRTTKKRVNRKDTGSSANTGPDITY
jgi:hypothetical protein